MNGSDVGPFPNTFVPNTVTLMLVEGGQSDDENSKTWLQTLPSQEEAGMVAEPHLLPKAESE